MNYSESFHDMNVHEYVHSLGCGLQFNWGLCKLASTTLLWPSTFSPKGSCGLMWKTELWRGEIAEIAWMYFTLTADTCSHLILTGKLPPILPAVACQVWSHEPQAETNLNFPSLCLAHLWIQQPTNVLADLLLSSLHCKDANKTRNGSQKSKGTVQI